MFCKNCGSEVNESLLFCTNCGAPVNNSSNDAVNSTSYSAVNESTNYTVQNGEPIKTTGLLVWSIIEIVCFCFSILTGIAGLVSIILYFVNLKPAVERGDREAALKSKKTIKIILWIGIVLLVIGMILSLVATVLVTLPMVNNASNMGIKARSELDDLQSMLDSMESSSYSSTYDDYAPYDYDFDF